MSTEEWTNLATIVNGVMSVGMLLVSGAMAVFAFLTLRASQLDYFHSVLTGLLHLSTTTKHPVPAIIDATESLLRGEGKRRKKERDNIYQFFGISKEDVEKRKSEIDRANTR